jgi:hypothetical protein
MVSIITASFNNELSSSESVVIAVRYSSILICFLLGLYCHFWVDVSTLFKIYYIRYCASSK